MTVITFTVMTVLIFTVTALPPWKKIIRESDFMKSEAKLNAKKMYKPPGISPT